MKNLRFLRRNILFRGLLAYILAFGAGQLSAETLSGYVYDECSGAPVVGAKIKLSIPLANYQATTDQNGLWVFNFLGSDPPGLYLITLSSPQGASSPGSYTHYHPGSSQSGLNFNVLPHVFGINMNGEEISWQNNPSSPHTVCSNVQNCIDLVPTGEIPIENGPYCYKVSLYGTDSGGSQGNLLAESDCESFGRLEIGNPCDHGSFDLTALLNGIVGELPSVIRMEVQQFCCQTNCVEAEGALVNTEVVFIEVLDIGLAQACFMFEDPDGVNLIVPGADCENAVAYCQVDVEVDGTCSSGAIDRYWMEVSEYDINTCDFIRVLADGSSNPTSIGSLNDLDGINLNNYVRDHWVVDPNPQWPYFLQANPPKNFEVTLFVENACGVYSKTGWFDNSIQCLTGGGNGENSIIAPLVSSNELAPLGGDLKILIFPNPVSDISKLRFQLSGEVEVLIEVSNISGEVLKKIEPGTLPKGINELSLDLSGLPSGSYTLKMYAGDESAVIRIAKF